MEDTRSNPTTSTYCTIHVCHVIIVAALLDCAVRLAKRELGHHIDIHNLPRVIDIHGPIGHGLEPCQQSSYVVVDQMLVSLSIAD